MTRCFSSSALCTLHALHSARCPLSTRCLLHAALCTLHAHRLLYNSSHHRILNCRLQTRIHGQPEPQVRSSPRSFTESRIPLQLCHAIISGTTAIQTSENSNCRWGHNKPIAPHLIINPPASYYPIHSLFANGHQYKRSDSSSHMVPVSSTVLYNNNMPTRAEIRPYLPPYNHLSTTMY